MFYVQKIEDKQSTTTCCSYLKKHSVPVLDMYIPNDEVGVTNGCDVLCNFESANKKREKRTQTSESAETKAERIYAGRLYLCVLSSRVKHTLSLSGRCVVSLNISSRMLPWTQHLLGPSSRIPKMSWGSRGGRGRERLWPQQVSKENLRADSHSPLAEPGSNGLTGSEDANKRRRHRVSR